MSMKNSNDTIGNRSRDLPVCSAVPQTLLVFLKYEVYGLGLSIDVAIDA
jgi:hypothetical protein